ncbi:MAG: type IV secretion system protein [Actinomycetota bacterium]|nr:type IV secretion system protein [Actinomycetota bacterium]
MTRRASLLVSAICVSVALASVPALALFGIGDVVFDPSVFAQTLATAEELARQIEVMRQQYNQLVQTYQAIAHLPDTVLQSLAAQLNTQQFRSPITTDPAAVVSAIAGLQLGDAGASARQYWQRNNVYTAPGQDFLANQLAMRGNSVAAVQGLVNDLYASATQHAQALQGLESELNSAPDGKAVQDIGARIQMEQAHLQARQIQAQTLTAFQAAQQRNEDTQRDQLRRCQYDEVIAAGRTQTPLTSSSCGNGMAAGSTPVAGNGNIILASVGGTNLGGSVTGAMAAQPWGQQASQYAQQMGVNPAVLAGVCQIESNCQNVAGSGTISGPFQMSDGTYNQTIREAIAQNPGLAGAVGGKTDPATQSIAASQYLRDAATSLQASGVQNPTGLDTRAYYNFGPAAGVNVATAPDSSNMAALLPAGTNLAANGLTPGMTVGQWRQMVTTRMGATAAHAPVLLNSTGT